MKHPELELEFHHLYTDYGQQLFRLCFRLMGNRQEAEDLMQDVFVAAFQGRERYRGDASIRTWLSRIAVLRARKLQKRRRWHRWLSNDDPAPAAPDEFRLALEQALEKLPEKLRIAFILAKLEELSMAEVSEILGIPVGTVKYHVFEATTRLRNALEDTGVLCVTPEETSTYAV